ncbi:uncharacterized protein TRIADDRAFT_5303, partial [Trichoplax adhaerens]
KWNYNWDNRQPLAKDDSSKNTVISSDQSAMPTASRMIILIRHGNYNTRGLEDSDRKLTILGHQQAHVTGKRLQSILTMPVDNVYYSTMTRATETANIINQYLKYKHIQNCSLIEEGAPIRPEPPLSSYRPDDYQYKVDHARIESAFRKYFHRADVDQKENSIDVIICHANVIRYFVCRALQLPPEAWLRISIGHCSITTVVIRPSGRVTLRGLGDIGHVPPDLIS